MVFPGLHDGSRLWKQACGKGYEDWLTPSEMGELKLLFQKRHLLAHNEGMVDEKYIARSGDNTYKIGQRIVIKDSDIRNFVNLITKIAKEIKIVAGSIISH